MDAISAVIGREVRCVELSGDEMVERRRGEGYPYFDIDFFVTMRSNPSESGSTVLPTVEQVTGASARTLDRRSVAAPRWPAFGGGSTQRAFL
ncbi:hypothetical protein ACFHW2_15145 [Actinomadura sp. LOL_016]|uniref:hypothetical protein n=1 Tax=unclassified Actinomadura TaxID=2626254 RepID=UPI003A81111F